MLLDPLASLNLSQEVIIANCLVNVTKRKAYLRVFNPRQNDVRLEAHKVFATVKKKTVVRFDT